MTNEGEARACDNYSSVKGGDIKEDRTITSSNDSVELATELRRRAEKELQQTSQSPEALFALSPEETRRTLHELRVHQIELETQNTELRRAQEELESERRRYFDLYELAPVGYCTVSEEGLITQANLSAAGLLGITRDVKAGRPIFSRYILEEDQDMYYRQRKKLLASAVTKRCELRMVKKDGTVFWAHLEISLDRDAGVTMYRIVLSNITARKEAEEVLLLRQSEEKYRTLIEYSSDPIFSFNVDLTYRFVNEAFARSFGKTPADIIDQSPYAIFTKDEAEKHLALIRQVFSTGEKKDVEVKVVTQSGEVRDYWTLADPIKNAQGQVLFVTCIAKDITERKKLEKNILQMLSIATHDMRSPIVTIASIIKLLARGRFGEVNESVKQTLNDVFNRMIKLEKIVGDYLTKTSVMGSTEIGRKETLDLRENIIDPILSEFSEEIEEGEVKIDNRLGGIPGDKILVSANKNWLGIVYRNLLANAIRYTPKGGTVAFGFEDQGDIYRLNVFNNGPSIPPEKTKTIFEMFESDTGSGIGLPVIRELVRRHGGDLWCEEAPGGHPNFVFTLPKEGKC